MKRLLLIGLLAALATAACDDSAASKPDAGTTPPDGAAASFDSGTELKIPVGETGRTYIKLSPPSIATEADWDLAFEGFDVFTNSGASGTGKAAAFGPLDAVTFLGDTSPQVPFLTEDKTGGAFLDWYSYEGESHALWSRYHVYGVRDGERTFKVQVLGYYGQRDGAAISALYKVRYAEIGGGAAEQTIDLDGTAGGTAAPDSSPSECLDLGTGARTMLTPDAARASSAWHLCFRRSSISVNGELGGPRNVGAVDLEADKVASETVDAVKIRTADATKSAFDAANAASFDGKTFRGDRIVSAFGENWRKSATEPTNAAWLVQSAGGTQKFLLGFTSFESPTAKSPGTVVARIKPVKG